MVGNALPDFENVILELGREHTRQNGEKFFLAGNFVAKIDERGFSSGLMPTEFHGNCNANLELEEVITIDERPFQVKFVQKLTNKVYTIKFQEMANHEN